MTQIVIGFAPGSFGGVTGATRYAPIGIAGGSLASAETGGNVGNVTWRVAGSFSTLYANIYSNAATASSSITFRKNAVNGNQTLSIAASTTGEFTDNTHTDSIVAGDKIDFAYQNGTGGAMNASAVTELFSPTTTGNTVSKYVACSSINDSASSTTIYEPFTGRLEGTSSTVEANAQFKNEKTATLQNLYLGIASNSGTTATFASRINSVNGNLSISVTSGTSGILEDNTHTDSTVAGDLLNTILSPVAGTSFTVGGSGIEYLTTSGDIVYVAGDTLAGSMLATHYHQFMGNVATTVTTEANTQITTNIAFTGSFLSARISANSGTGSLNFRKNGANGNQTVSITTTGYFQDTTHTDSIASTDKINFQSVPGTSFTITTMSMFAAYGAAGNVATWTGHSSFSAVGSALNSQSATFSPKSTFSPHGVAAKKTAATWSAHSSLSAVGVAAAETVAAWSGHASFSAINASLGKGIATWSPHSSLLVTGKGLGNGVATWTAHSSLSFSSSSLGRGVATWSAHASFSPISASLGKGVAIWSPNAIFNAVGTHIGGGSKAIFSASAAFFSTGSALAKSAFNINAAASLAFISQSISAAGGVSAVPARGVGTIPPGLSMAHGMSSRKGMSGSIYRS